MAIGLATASFTAADQAMPTLALGRGIFTISLTGTFVGTITLQRSFDAGVSWHDVEDFTLPTQKNGEAAEYMHARLLCKIYVSGTANARLSWG